MMKTGQRPNEASAAENVRGIGESVTPSIGPLCAETSADILEWESRLAIALDQLGESHPKAISAAASVIKAFLDHFACHPEVVERLLGPQRSSVIAQLLSAAGGENAYVQSATIGALV